MAPRLEHPDNVIRKGDLLRKLFWGKPSDFRDLGRIGLCCHVANRDRVVVDVESRFLRAQLDLSIVHIHPHAEEAGYAYHETSFFVRFALGGSDRVFVPTTKSARNVPMTNPWVMVPPNQKKSSVVRDER